MSKLRRHIKMMHPDEAFEILSDGDKPLHHPHHPDWEALLAAAKNTVPVATKQQVEGQG